MKDIEAAKERVQIEKDRRRQKVIEARAMRKMKAEEDLMDIEGDAEEGQAETSKLSALLRSAELRSKAFDAMDANDEEEPPLLVAQEKDNSKKAYFVEFKKVIQDSDIVLQVLDCRDPLGSRDPSTEHWIQQCGPEKKLVFVLNKIDLVPKENAQAWLKYLRNEYPTVPFCQSQKQIFVDGLLGALKSYSKRPQVEGKKASIVVGVIGFPNVGKSSLINSLKREKACAVGSTPGLTKRSQLVHLDGSLKLLDSPGIVFSAAETAGIASDLTLRNCLRPEQLEDPIAPVGLILQKCPKDKLLSIYSIADFSNATEFLSLVAKKYGKLLKGGVPNVVAAAKIVLQDWNSGKVPFYTIPPSRDHEQLQASIMADFSPEFNLDLYVPPSTSGHFSVSSSSVDSKAIQ